jgi:Domain of unknown function (DUF4136)
MRLDTRRVFLSAFLFMVAYAYGQDVHYNYDHSANFAAYKSYQWVELPGPGGAVSDQLIDQSIKRAVDEQLSQKGLTQVEKDGYLEIGYHAIIREEKAIDLSGFGTGIGPWGGGLGPWNGGTVTGQISTIPIGTLVIDLYDPIRKQLVWRGDVTKTLDVNKSPDKNYRALQKAMSKLFKNYPPALNR